MTAQPLMNLGILNAYNRIDPNKILITKGLPTLYS